MDVYLAVNSNNYQSLQTILLWVLEGMVIGNTFSH